MAHIVLLTLRRIRMAQLRKKMLRKHITHKLKKGVWVKRKRAIVNKGIAYSRWFRKIAQ